MSVVIPTYNESENVQGLLPRIHAVLTDTPHELIVVDDSSPDGTGEIVEKMALSLPVRLVRRPTKSGLAGAARAGFAEARGEIIGLMDADWSHDPEALPALLSAFDDQATSLVIGSRLIAGGLVENWPIHRRLISWVASLPARKLSGVRDPMSGFFFFRRELCPIALGTTVQGYKILVDLLSLVDRKAVAEVPITFRDRMHGETKLNSGEMWTYVNDLISVWRRSRRRPDPE